MRAGWAGLLLQRTSEQRRKIENPRCLARSRCAATSVLARSTSAPKSRIGAHSGEHGIDGCDPIISPAGIVGALQTGERAVRVADERTRDCLPP